MAAIEREERGGAIAYWGVKTFRIGNQVLLAYTNICLLCTADIPIGKVGRSCMGAYYVLNTYYVLCFTYNTLHTYRAKQD